MSSSLASLRSLEFDGASFVGSFRSSADFVALRPIPRGSAPRPPAPAAGSARLGTLPCSTTHSRARG